ncbi:Tripartite DNA replication factor, partial [Quaeritorhiza haematococci]
IVGKGQNLKLERGKRYKLLPRLIDFNTKKLVTNLIEIDMDARKKLNSTTPSSSSSSSSSSSASASQLPTFLRALRDTNQFGTETPDDEDTLKSYRDDEARLFTLYKELTGLNPQLEGLSLHKSQRVAFEAVMERRMTLLWGPPGHGKTHTLALSALRLIEIIGRKTLSTKPFRILVTAFTKAAITAFTKKFNALLELIRSIEGLDRGEWRDEVEVVGLVGVEESKMPNPGGLRKYAVVTGTVWSIAKYVKKFGEKVDFDMLIIDEGSQMPVAEAAIAMRALDFPSNVAKSPRIVVAGDHLQLAPILKGTYPQDPDGAEPRLFGSILECLMRDSHGHPVSMRNLGMSLGSANRRRRGLTAGTLSSEGHPDIGPLTFMLAENFRMVDQLCSFTQSIYTDGTRKFEVVRPQQRAIREAIVETIQGWGGEDDGEDARGMISNDLRVRTFLETIALSKNVLITLVLDVDAG